MKFDWYTAFVTTGGIFLSVLTGLSLIATIVFAVVGEPGKMAIAGICFFLGIFLLSGFAGGAA